MDTNEYGKWTRLIGEFMVLFAHVEFDVVDALVEFTDGSHEEYKGQKFKDRLKKLESIVCKMPLNEVNQMLLHAAIKTLKDLTHTRNLIAHTPLQLPLDSIFKDIPDLEIRSFQKKNDVVTRQQLERRLKKLSDVNEILHNTLGVASFNS